VSARLRYLEIRSVGGHDPTPLPWWIKLLTCILLAGNPDIDQYVEQADRWWLEIDEAGLPLREIGFNAQGNAIVFGPVPNNYGFLIDASDDWSDSTEDSAAAAQNFDTVWDNGYPQFEQMTRRSPSE